MPKITPYFWFDNNAQEAMKWYATILPDSQVINTMSGPDGKVMGGTVAIMGHEIMTLNGGPQFTPNPSISLFVNVKEPQQIDQLWEKLSQDGQILMPLETYPFASKYGWLQDKYGLSWQLAVSDETQSIHPSLLFTQESAGKTKDAITFYTSLFPNSNIEDMSTYQEGEGDVVGYIKYAQFSLDGQTFSAMDSSADHKFIFSEGASLFVECHNQAEVDELWTKLTANGGEESMCGWCKDRFGLWWQVIPVQLGQLLSNPDRDKANKAMQAMLSMKKIVIADLEAAANQ